MKVEKLTFENLEGFINYCKEYRYEMDDSYLYDDDLKRVKVGEENPTYILKDENNNIIGASSLIIDQYNKKARKGRFRIFHSTSKDINSYKLLLEAILVDTKEIDKIFIIINDQYADIKDIFNSLGFKINRRAFLFKRDVKPIGEVVFPEGYELKDFQFDRDEEHWCEVRNQSFATLKGSETPKTPAMINDMKNGESTIEGGMKILYHNSRPVAVAGISKDRENDMDYGFIHSVGVKPEYQGKSLGRNMLRAVLKHGETIGLGMTMLSVNEENYRAVNLYLKEGYYKVESVASYEYEVENR